EALEVILMPKNLSYHVEGKSIVVKKGKQKNIVLQKEIEDSAIQQTRIIRGRVSNEAGTPLSGISVLIKGTTIGTSTNDNGLYTIEVPVGNRKSTRLNSSHVKISYAVFCLKKKIH